MMTSVTLPVYNTTEDIVSNTCIECVCLPHFQVCFTYVLRVGIVCNVFHIIILHLSINTIRIPAIQMRSNAHQYGKYSINNIHSTCHTMQYLQICLHFFETLLT